MLKYVILGTWDLCHFLFPYTYNIQHPPHTHQIKIKLKAVTSSENGVKIVGCRVSCRDPCIAVGTPKTLV